MRYDKPIWVPSSERIAKSAMMRFMNDVGCADYESLYRWSIENIGCFWERLWDFCGIIGERGEGSILLDEDKMPGARFFPSARINYAENMLIRRDNADAIVFWGEDQIRYRLSWSNLYDSVARAAQALKHEGVQPGDRLAGYLPNIPEAVVAMLATAAVGAIWSSASPDFGVAGLLDRFSQIQPKLLIASDGYIYNGKRFGCHAKLVEIMAKLPSVQKLIIIPYAGDSYPAPAGAVLWDDFLAPFQPNEISYQRVPFNQPQFILYSSGTTGVPKCILHGAGGTLLQHVKELSLHADIRADDRVLYFTTTGWMMWNWVVSSLSLGATLLLYDGSPSYPNYNIMFDYLDAERGSFFGTSAKFIDSLSKASISPIKTHRLKELRSIASTGSPLAPEGFDYIYNSVKHDVALTSISGGTDIISCFALGNPVGPIYRGELQTRGLGMAVDVFDIDGRSLRGEKGELVCCKPFVSMPVAFWGDPTGERYRGAYFERYPNVWCHGDFVELTPHQGLIVYGRSDSVLNPGGVRIGTAEIYRQVAQIPEVIESVAIGQDWQNDVRVVLFVRLRPDTVLDDELRQRIVKQIRNNTSPRHVPAKIIAVTDIPRTKSGKITEIAVRDVVHGRKIYNEEALANPESLALFSGLIELKE